MRVVRAFVREPEESQRFGSANADLTQTSLNTGRLMAIMFPSVMLVVNLSSVAAVWIGGDRIANGDMQVGALVAFLCVSHPDPHVGDDGELRRCHDAPRRGQRRPDRRGARRTPVDRRTRGRDHGDAGRELARVPQRRVPLPRRRLPGALRHHVHRPCRRDHRHHRQHRRRQDHPPESRAATVRRDRRVRARERGRRPRRRARGAVEPHRPRPPEALPVLRHRRQQSPSRRPGRIRGAAVVGARHRASRGFRAGDAPTTPLADQPGRHERVGRPAPATRDRPRPHRPAGHLHVRRLVLSPRPRHRRTTARGARPGRRATQSP